MKKSIFTLALTTFVAGTILTSCSTPAQKVETAQDNVAKANEDLNKAQDNYAADVEKFRKESDEKIATNEKSIADFDARIAKEKKEVKAEYKKKIAALEQKNTDMKKRMDDYKADGKDKWETFKTEFNAEMNELGKSLNDLTTSKK